MRPKAKAGIGAAAALIWSLFAAAPADAQRAQSRQRVPPSAGTAVPRQAMPRIPSHLAGGVRWRGPGASVQIYYQRGIPFVGGFPGYFWNDFWFLDGYGPRFPPYGAQMPYGAVVAQQWRNVSRLTPPIGWSGWNTLAAGQYAPPDEELMRENQELRERLQQYELDAARREGYEQARRELSPGQPQEQKAYFFGYAENGQVCNEQFQSEGNGLLNRVFEAVYENTGRRLRAYTYSRSGRPYTAVLDLQNSELVTTENYAGLSNPKSTEFVKYIDGLLGRVEINRSDYVQEIKYLSHTAACR